MAQLKSSDKIDAENDAAQTPMPEKKKGRKLVATLVILCALFLGVGGASAYFLIFGNGPKPAIAKTRAGDKPVQLSKLDIEDPVDFVEVNRVALPLYDENDALQGYMNVDISLEVRSSNRDYVLQRLPHIRHAFNEMAATTDLRDPSNTEKFDFSRASNLLFASANGALPEKVILSLSITNAMQL